MTSPSELLDRFDAALAETRSRQDEELVESPEEVISRFFEHLQGFVWIRRVVGGLFLCALVVMTGYFIWDVLPRHYTLHISGGDILSNRHRLVTVLRNEARRQGLNIVIQPISGTLANLEAVENRTVDVALIQGGLDMPLPNVRHVTSVQPEMVHLLVKPGIKSLTDLKGKRINVGGEKGGTQFIGEHFLSFSELAAEIDYHETFYSAEELTTLPDRKMPDAVVLISTLPSFLAEELIENRGYRLLEIPFPEALAMRYGWVAGATILAYTYGIQPPVPAVDTETLGINMFMVAHKDVPPKAILKLLDVLYSSGVSTALRHEFDPKTVTLPSGYPLSEGTESFLKRNDPLFSQENIEELQGYAGLLMGALTILMVVVRWLKGRSGDRGRIEQEFQGYIALVSDFNRVFPELLLQGESKTVLDALALRLLELRNAILQRTVAIKTLDPTLMAALTSCFETADSYIVEEVRTRRD